MSEMLKLDDLKNLHIEGYKFDDNIVYESDSISFTKEDDEDDFIIFTRTKEFDLTGEETGDVGLVVEFNERCTVVKMHHFSPLITLDGLQAYFNKLTL